MNQAMFIVWRESVEALLVIGILQAWISRQSGHSRLARFPLGRGVGGVAGFGGPGRVDAVGRRHHDRRRG